MPEDRPSWAADYIRRHCNRCPACGSIWSPTVDRCTCGYDFKTQTMVLPSGSRGYNPLWPKISDLESAAAAARDGAAAAFVVAGVTAIFSVLAYFNLVAVVSPWAWIDAVAMAVLGFLIRGMSRAAAVIALGWFVAARIQGALTRSVAPNVLLGVLLLVGFVSGVRGAFGYRRLAGSKFALTVVLASPMVRFLGKKRRA